MRVWHANPKTMKIGGLPLLIVGVSCLAFQQTFAACSIGKMIELPVTITAKKALVPVKLNGVDEKFIVASGTFYSFLSAKSAAELKLKLTPSPRLAQGLQRYESVSTTRVKAFSLATTPLEPDFQFVVDQDELGSDAAGVLGQNVLGIADTEYDLSDGVLNLMKPTDCADHALAYWATAASLPYGVMEIDATAKRAGETIGNAYVNGTKIRVRFDTGAPLSILTLAAAKRAGVTPDAAGVVATGNVNGLAQESYRSWVGPFESFKIAGEETRNTRLRFADVSFGGVDMLLGMDFFLSHRIYVANSQNKLYLTYNGGPVFNLAGTAASGKADSVATVPPPLGSQGSEPTTADGFAARASASAARHDFEHAITYLSRATELDPKNPDYFYQRARAYWSNKQPALAISDLDQALQLKPEYVAALVTRADLHLLSHDTAAARADLDVADRSASKDDELRRGMGNAYLDAALPSQAVDQYDLWITAHPNSSLLAIGLNDRCWARVLWAHELDKAEKDCNTALRLMPGAPNVLDSRGWLYFRLGKFDRSIKDFNAALDRQPKLASSLYGRGLGELRLGRNAAGKADIAAATTLDPQVTDLLSKYGIAP